MNSESDQTIKDLLITKHLTVSEQNFYPSWLNKGGSLIYLREHSFNVPQFEIVKTKKHMHTLLGYIEPFQYRVSIRTYSSVYPGQPHCPFFPYHKIGPKFLSDLEVVLEKGYWLICSEPVPVRLPSVKGNALIFTNRNGSSQKTTIYEVHSGFGTIRDKENLLKKFSYVELGRLLYSYIEKGVRPTDVKDFLFDIQRLEKIFSTYTLPKSFIVEFTFFLKAECRFGYKSKPWLFWEIRPGC